MSDTDLECLHLANKLSSGDLEAGEELLEITGRADHCMACSMPKFFDAIQSAIGSSTTKVKEISIGIVANMVLCEATCAEVVKHMKIPATIVHCFEEEDPFILAEVQRVMANLVYRKRSDIIPFCEMVVSFSQFVVENSLSAHLLAQTYQLVFYIQIYGEQDLQNEFYAFWKAPCFYTAALTCALEVSLETSSNSETEIAINHILPHLQSELLNNCSGLEWLLLSLDSYTLYCRNYTDMTIDARTASICMFVAIELLLSGRDIGWNCDIAGSKQSFSAFTLNNNEKFLLLSALENVVYIAKYDRTETVDVCADIEHLCARNSTGKKHGFTTLLVVILGIAEDAILMRDAATLSSAVFLIANLFAPHSVQTSDGGVLSSSSQNKDNLYDLKNHIADVFVPVRNFVEMISLEDVAPWVVSTTCSTQGDDGGDLRAALHVLKGSLHPHANDSQDGQIGATLKAYKSVNDCIESLLSCFDK